MMDWDAHLSTTALRCLSGFLALPGKSGGVSLLPSCLFVGGFGGYHYQCMSHRYHSGKPYKPAPAPAGAELIADFPAAWIWAGIVAWQVASHKGFC